MCVLALKVCAWRIESGRYFDNKWPIVRVGDSSDVNIERSFCVFLFGPFWGSCARTNGKQFGGRAIATLSGVRGRSTLHATTMSLEVGK